MSEWQPIETAPKDGTWVLLFHPENGARGPVSIRQFRDWYCGSGLGQHILRRWVDEFSQTRPEFEPTHWMPLPEPPK